MISVISSLESRHDKIKQLLTCPICKKLLRQVTAIDECLHIFCRKCITAKLTEEKLNKCPVCEVDLGVFPLQKLRADYRWQSIRNSMKFKRRQFIERGLIERKKSHQASDAKPPPEVVLLSSESLSVINEEEEEEEDDEDEDEDEDEEYSPLPVTRRKEKSISSVLRAEKRAVRKSSSSSSRGGGGGRGRGRGRTKSSNPRRRSSSSSSSIVVSVPTIKESSSNPVKSGNGEHGTQKNIKPSNHEELSSNHDKKGKREMNPSLKLLDHIPTTSKDTVINMSASPSQPHPNIIAQETTDDHQENSNNKGKKGKEIDNHHHHQSDGETTASGSRNNIASRSSTRRSRGGGGGSVGGGGREKRAVVTEDLNLPAQVVLDASSSKCFRSNHIWFSLVASSDNQDDCLHQPPLPPYYVKIKDTNMPASFLKKYLVKKLRLCSENEVELTMRGRPISPDCPVDELVNLWKETTPTLEKKPAMVGDSAKDYVMVVTYRRCPIALPY